MSDVNGDAKTRTLTKWTACQIPLLPLPKQQCSSSPGRMLVARWKENEYAYCSGNVRVCDFLQESLLHFVEGYRIRVWTRGQAKRNEAYFN